MVLYDPQYHQKRAAALAQRKRDEEDALMRKPTRLMPPTAYDARRVPPRQALQSPPAQTTPTNCVKAGRTMLPAEVPPCTDKKRNAARRPRTKSAMHTVQACDLPASSDDDDDGLALKKVQSLTAQISALEASLTASRDAAAAAALAHQHQLKTMHAAQQDHIMALETSVSATRAAAETARQQELGNLHSTRRQLVHSAKSTAPPESAIAALGRARCCKHDTEIRQLRDELRVACELSAMTLKDVSAQTGRQLGAPAAMYDNATACHETKALRAVFQAVLVARDAAAKASHERKRRTLETLHARAVADLEADLAQVHQASANVVRRLCLEHDQVVRDMQTAMELETMALQSQIKAIEPVAAQLLQAQDESKRWRLALHRTVMAEAATVASMWILVSDVRGEMERRPHAIEEASVQREADMVVQHALQVQRLQDELDRADAAHAADLALHAEAVEAMDDLYMSTVAGHEATTGYLEWQLQAVAWSSSCRT